MEIKDRITFLAKVVIVDLKIYINLNEMT